MEHVQDHANLPHSRLKIVQCKRPAATILPDQQEARIATAGRTSAQHFVVTVLPATAMALHHYPAMHHLP